MSDFEGIRHLFVDAEGKRARMRRSLEIVGAWLLLIGSSALIWYGVLRAIGAL